MKALTLKKYHDHAPCSFAYKVICIDKFSKPIVIYRGENAAYEFIKAILKKNLIMSEEEQFFNRVAVVGSVKNLMMMKKLKIIVT